ncbi:guanine nucleotide binding protein, alpha subunit [Gloeopeniophorella convolvens]|nr:guanine nucleotide binding protein, alpha subunit [Gloeopeniophorella convolvens]
MVSRSAVSPAPSEYEDPLSRWDAPPEGESIADREARLRQEQEAKRVSEKIDEQINQERLASKRGPKPVKLLLLGQSESGKSTTLKNFQLLASPKAFRAERAIWRAVIQLNVVRSIHLILNIMSEAQRNQQIVSPPVSPRLEPVKPVSDPSSDDPPRLTPEHLRLKMRLSPLVQVEEALVRKLQASAGQPGSGYATSTVDSFSAAREAEFAKEVAVNSGSGWKGNFAVKIMSRSKSRADSDEDSDGDGINWDDPDDPGRVIHACAEDMKMLWADRVVQRLLIASKVRMREMSGFFLDSLDRVAAPRYVPSDDDILRARIKTLGVTEYRFHLNSKAANKITSREWHIFDVGGHRSMVRSAWIPFFDDMNAIIFLAPISCFDQSLEEDPSVNRLEDSVLLWKSIVSNPLLVHTNMVLFLNKCDILREKLSSGVQFGRYVTSYGDRPNDFQSTAICTCLRPHMIVHLGPREYLQICGRSFKAFFRSKLAGAANATLCAI